MPPREGPPDDPLGQLIWERREGKFNQEALAARLGIARTYLSKIENGVHRPKRPLREALARELGGSADDYRLLQPVSTREEMSALRADVGELREFVAGMFEQVLARLPSRSVEGAQPLADAREAVAREARLATPRPATRARRKPA